MAAREGHLPEIFSYVHVRHLTPLPSLIVSVSMLCCHKHCDAYLVSVSFKVGKFNTISGNVYRC